VDVALSGTRVTVVVTIGERELEGVMDAEPVTVPVAEARMVTVTVAVGESDRSPVLVAETLPVAAPLPLRVGEGDAVPHAVSVGEGE